MKKILIKKTYLVSILMVGIVLGFSAYDWGWNQQGAKKTDTVEEKADKPLSSWNLFGTKPKASAAKELSDEEIKNLHVPSLPDLPRETKVSDLTNIPSQPVKVSSYKNTNIKKAVPPPAVNDIQDRIQEIIKFNEDAKPRYKNEATELQRITQQAQFHKRILKDLERTQKAASMSLPPDTRELVRQEKIRLINEETQKNKDFVENLKQNE